MSFDICGLVISYSEEHGLTYLEIREKERERGDLLDGEARFPCDFQPSTPRLALLSFLTCIRFFIHQILSPASGHSRESWYISFLNNKKMLIQQPTPLRYRRKKPLYEIINNRVKPPAEETPHSLFSSSFFSPFLSSRNFASVASSESYDQFFTAVNIAVVHTSIAQTWKVYHSIKRNSESHVMPRNHHNRISNVQIQKQIREKQKFIFHFFSIEMHGQKKFHGVK